MSDNRIDQYAGQWYVYCVRLSDLGCEYCQPIGGPFDSFEDAQDALTIFNLDGAI